MIRDCDWRDKFYRGCFGAFTIVKGLGPVTHCGKGLILALYGVRGPISLWLGAHCYLAGCTWPISPCGEGLIVIPSPVAILGKWFVTTFVGKRLNVAIFDGWVLLGVLSILALGNVHAILGALLPLAMYMPLATYTPSLAYLPYPTLAYSRCWSLHGATWLLTHPTNGNMNILLLHGSCYILPLHLLLYCYLFPCNPSIKNDCCVIDIVVVALQSILLLVICAFAIIDVVHPHQRERLVVACAIMRTHHNQLWLLLPGIRQKEILLM